MTMDKDQEIARLRQDIRDLMMGRAHMVHDFLCELEQLIDKDKIVTAMRTAMYKQGQKQAVKVISSRGGKKISPVEAVQVYEQTSPDLGRLLPLSYTCDDDGSCTVKTLACPLKDAMEAIDATQEEFTAMVTVLDGTTVGILEGLGLNVETTLPTLHNSICCKLHIQ